MCKHAALGVEMGSSTSHSLGDMGLEGQGQQIKVSDQLPWLQGERTLQEGVWRPVRKQLQAQAHHYSLNGAFRGQTVSLLPLLPLLFPLPVLPFPWLSLWVWTGGGHGLLTVVFSHRSEEERWGAVASMHRGLACSGHPPCRP